jgi:hypothetical protein
MPTKIAKILIEYSSTLSIVRTINLIVQWEKCGTFQSCEKCRINRSVSHFLQDGSVSHFCHGAIKAYSSDS